MIRLNEVINEIKDTEKKCGRQDGSVKLLAVSKFHPIESICQAIEQGQKLFGENRVQEAFEKFSVILKKYPDIELHIIGQLQTNKVKKAISIATVIESVDRLELVQEIEKQCAKIQKNIKILFEFHTAEDSKSGFKTYEELYNVVEYINKGNAPHVIPIGFMTMAPLTNDEQKIRSSFRLLKEIATSIQEKFPQYALNCISMGMSNDYKIAIQEGSTEVRIGTAIFGERDYSNK